MADAAERVRPMSPARVARGPEARPVTRYMTNRAHADGEARRRYSGNRV